MGGHLVLVPRAAQLVSLCCLLPLQGKRLAGKAMALPLLLGMWLLVTRIHGELSPWAAEGTV